jgi:hypothetical protein
VPCVRQADHQRGIAATRRHDRVVGENEAGARAREASEHQAGQHGEEAHSSENFDGRDKMPVFGLRMHVPITDGRQRLDGEVEEIEQAFRGNIGDGLIAE